MLHLRRCPINKGDISMKSKIVSAAFAGVAGLGYIAMFAAGL